MPLQLPLPLPLLLPWSSLVRRLVVALMPLPLVLSTLPLHGQPWPIDAPPSLVCWRLSSHLPLNLWLVVISHIVKLPLPCVTFHRAVASCVHPHCRCCWRCRVAVAPSIAAIAAVTVPSPLRLPLPLLSRCPSPLPLHRITAAPSIAIIVVAVMLLLCRPSPLLLPSRLPLPSRRPSQLPSRHCRAVHRNCCRAIHSRCAVYCHRINQLPSRCHHDIHCRHITIAAHCQAVHLLGFICRS